MNAQDEKELVQQMNNPEFAELWYRLVGLRMVAQQDIDLAASAPTKEESRQDVIPIITLRIPHGYPIEEVRNTIDMYRVNADSLAVRLAKFFPERRRWHWIQVLKNVGMGGSGTIEQARKGGAPKGQRERTEADMKAVYEEWARLSAADPELSQSEFCKQRGVSRSKLRRAISKIGFKKQG